ncbi:UNVERIFIED_CONTAM: hypothetical protein K2H54_000068 [Gekko kuhli]
MNKILLVPGLHNSGPDHWQSRWHQYFPHWQRMVGLPWDRPDLTVWSAKLASKLRSRRGRAHLVAHSFGALAAITAARQQPDKVASLFIVAPADPARFGLPDELLAGSLKWQVPLFDAGEVGHINVQSGHGEWNQGLNLLGTLYRRAEMVVEPTLAVWEAAGGLEFSLSGDR